VICAPGAFLERHCDENKPSVWYFVSSRAQMGPCRAEVIDDALTADKPSGCELHVYSKARSYVGIRRPRQRPKLQAAPPAFSCVLAGASYVSSGLATGIGAGSCSWVPRARPPA
jgi:hypothetical protein